MQCGAEKIDSELANDLCGSGVAKAVHEEDVVDRAGDADGGDIDVGPRGACWAYCSPSSRRTFASSVMTRAVGESFS